MRCRRRLGFAVVGIGVLFLLAGLCPQAAKALVSLETYEDEAKIEEVTRGHEFLVRVYVSSATDLYGSAFDLEYDPEFLNVIDTRPGFEKVYPKVTEADLLSEAGTAETLWLSALEDNEAGKVVVGICRKGSVAGVDVGADPALLLSVHFQAVATSQQTNIAFALKALQDSDANDIQVDTWQSGGIKVIDWIIRKLDLNDDGDIDLRDLILAMQVHTGQPTSEPVFSLAEVTGDGRIGMSEAVGILQVVSGLRDAPEEPE